MSTTDAKPTDLGAGDAAAFRRQQALTIGTMYVGYATSMLLRMIPTVAGTQIREDPALAIDLETWGTVIAAGTCGAMAGKFVCGWAADRFGGRITFSVALLVASLAVGMFGMSSTVYAFQAALFVTQMAQAAGWPSMTKIITNWASPRQYGRVWGILSTSSRVGTLTATFALGSLLAVMSWRGMLWLAAVAGGCIAMFYGVWMRDRPAEPIPDDDAPADGLPITAPVHPFDDLTLAQALPRMLLSLRFWLISGSLMGLTILWDFLVVVPLYMQDTLHLTAAQASRAASAFPLGSLISVLIGGYVFDRLDRKTMGIVMAGLLAIAVGCLFTFAKLPAWELAGLSAMLVPLTLLFLFGLCVSPCYYIPCSVFSIDFGGRHSGFLVAILDAIGFAATAAFYYFVMAVAQHRGWPTFLFVLAGVGTWSLVLTYFFMQREGRTIRRRAAE